jgi:hypothetical protein
MFLPELGLTLPETGASMKWTLFFWQMVLGGGTFLGATVLILIIILPELSLIVIHYRFQNILNRFVIREHVVNTISHVASKAAGLLTAFAPAIVNLLPCFLFY